MFGFFRDERREASAARLYGDLLAQARQPALFSDHGVPDTVEGRCDMMILHLALAMRRLSRDQDGDRDVAQALCDRFFTEMDRALREMGVGDLTVPKQMKAIAALYAGCTAAYDEALGGPETALVSALRRNVFEDRPGTERQAAGLADYVRQAASALDARSRAAIIDQGFGFPRPDKAGEAAA